MPRRRPHPALGPVLALALIAAACGGGAATSSAAPTTTAATTTTTQGTTTTTVGATTAAPTTTEGTTTTSSAFAGDTNPKSAPTRGTPYGTLTDVRTAQREGFTRIVFDFGGTDGIPEYDVRYQSPPFRNTADQDVPVAGSAFLRVRVFPAWRADLNLPDAPLTYTGPLRFDPHTASVEEVVFVEDFEALMIWVVGLTAQRPFTIGTLTDPPRIYVDIAD